MVLVHKSYNTTQHNSIFLPFQRTTSSNPNTLGNSTVGLDALLESQGGQEVVLTAKGCLKLSRRHHRAQGLGYTSKQKRHGVCITTTGCWLIVDCDCPDCRAQQRAVGNRLVYRLSPPWPLPHSAETIIIDATHTSDIVCCRSSLGVGGGAGAKVVGACFVSVWMDG